MSYAVALVDGGNDRLAALFEHDRDLSVVGREARLHVAQKHDDVRRLHGKLGLHAHLL